MNILLIKERQNEETTELFYIVESSDPKAADIAEGTHTLFDGGNAEIRNPLRAAAIASLEKQFSCKLEYILPVEGVELPDADSVSLGRYRDNIGNI